MELSCIKALSVAYKLFISLYGNGWRSDVIAKRLRCSGNPFEVAVAGVCDVRGRSFKGIAALRSR